MNKKPITPFAMVPTRILLDKRLTPTDIRVLIAILSFMTPQKLTCYPRRETIRQRCGVDIEKISVSTSRLVKFGWLRKTGNGGKSCSNVYEFLTPNESETVTYLETATSPNLLGGKKEIIKETNLIEEAFDEFWSLYPRKCGKLNAKKSWDQLNPTPDLCYQIIAAVDFAKNHNPQWNRDNGQFIPHPSTFLNNRRWEDDDDRSVLKPNITHRKNSGAINKINKSDTFDSFISRIMDQGVEV